MARTELVEVFEAAVTQYLAELDDREFAVLVNRVRPPATTSIHQRREAATMSAQIEIAYAEIQRQRDILVTGAVVHGVDAGVAGRYADDLAESLARQMVDGGMCPRCGEPEFAVTRREVGDRSEVHFERGCDC